MNAHALVIQRRVLTARKPATCACGAAIARGDQYGHTFANGLVTKACLPCHARSEQRERDEYGELDDIMDEIGDRAFGASDGGDSL
jgi:hypothetical protein